MIHRPFAPSKTARPRLCRGVVNTRVTVNHAHRRIHCEEQSYLFCSRK
jgi:hypothetical protein